MKKKIIKKVIELIITILTAFLTTLTTQSCIGSPAGQGHASDSDVPVIQCQLPLCHVG